MYVGRRMTRNVITVSPEDTLTRAAALMKERRVHPLPVVAGEEFAGIVTDTDIRNFSLGLTSVERGGGLSGSSARRMFWPPSSTPCVSKGSASGSKSLSPGKRAPSSASFKPWESSGWR